jgi:hypothetical protein
LHRRKIKSPLVKENYQSSIRQSKVIKWVYRGRFKQMEKLIHPVSHFQPGNIYEEM